MKHRFLLCVVFVSLVASAQPDKRAYDSSGESWSIGFGSEEGGGGSSYLGVDIADVTTERLSTLKLKEEHGAEITMVDSDAPAGKAGLHEHDVILSLNGTPVESAAQLRRMIKETPSGRIVTLGISRDGQPQEIKVQLADRKKSMVWEPNAREFKFDIPKINIPDFDIPVSIVIAHSSLRSGLMVENITPQLGEFFGVKGGKGVLVRSVEKGSRAEKAGFRAGDVIVKVNSQAVSDASDFTHALRGSSSNAAAVTVMREKKEQNLTLTLPEKKDSGLLLEDSFEIPEVSAETEVAVSHASNEMARLAPLKKSAEESIRKAQEAQQCAQERLQEQLEQQQDKMQDEQEKLQELQEELQENQNMIMDRNEEKLQHEVSGEWTEI